MLTTDGPTCLAIWVKLLDNSTGFGMVSAVAPGALAAPSPLAAFTPELTRVPITIPTESVNNISVNERAFCLRSLLKKLMGLLLLLRAMDKSLLRQLFRW